MRDHHEFARLLGISDDADGYDAKAFGRSELEELNGFLERITTGKINKDIEFWARVCASYLPRFLPVYATHLFNLGFRHMYAKTEEEMAFWLDGFKQAMDWFVDVVNTVHFNRFVRERPEEAIAFERKLVEYISCCPIEGATACLTEDGSQPHHDYLDFLLCVWSILFGILGDYLSIPLPLPSLETRQRLEALGPLALQIQKEYDDKDDDDWNSFIDFYGKRIRAGSADDGPMWIESEEGTYGTRWWTCEWAVPVTKRRKENDANEVYCMVNLDQVGAESEQACSRCGGVRYCCQAHQELHWPLHRRVCFRPRW